MHVGKSASATVVAASLFLNGPELVAQHSDARYGRQVDVPLDELILNPRRYVGRSVRTRGKLERLRLRGDSAKGYSLHHRLAGCVWVNPVPEVVAMFDMEAPVHLGHEVDVAGVLVGSPDSGGGLVPDGGCGLRLDVWELFGAAPEKPERIPGVSLESLVTAPGERDDRGVRVIGQFRGSNLFRDLPVTSRQGRSDWVLKDGDFAVWVTGAPPRGDGFRLDPEDEQDSRHWLEIVGRPRTRGDVTYLRADSVRLTNAPSRACLATAFAAPEGDAAPAVVCTSPADGDRIPPKTRFAIRFSRAMDEDSLKGRVFLRYVQRRSSARHRIGELLVEYDPELRALFLEPRRALLSGLELELRLLEGIVDSEGRDLVTRPDVRSPSGTVERLSFRIEGQAPD